MNNGSPLVSVVCKTYNHGKYIGQALDGFIMQQCSFPIEIIVHDDASTDNTANVIKEYLKKCSFMRAILQEENQYSKGNSFEGLYTKEAMGKYIAICEGDDYWIDPLKLEKQINFLEANPDYGMSYTKAICYIQWENEFKGHWGSYYNNFDSFMLANAIPTLTVVMKKCLLIKYFDEVNPSEKKWLIGDLPKWLWFVKNSKIHYEDCVTGVYRMLPESASRSKDIRKSACFFRSRMEVREYFMNRYVVKDKNIMQKFYYDNMLRTFYYACILNDDKLYDEIKKIICKKIKIGCLRKLYVKSVLYFRPMRYLYLAHIKIKKMTNQNKEV